MRPLRDSSAVLHGFRVSPQFDGLAALVRLGSVRSDWSRGEGPNPTLQRHYLGPDAGCYGVQDHLRHYPGKLLRGCPGRSHQRIEPKAFETGLGWGFSTVCEKSQWGVVKKLLPVPFRI